MLLLVAPDALLTSVKTTAQCAFLVWVVGILQCRNYLLMTTFLVCVFFP